MYYTAFTTEAPFNHVPRALDELARVDYILQDLRVSCSDGACVVEISFQPSDRIPVDCLLARLARLPGVGDVETVSLAPREAA